MSQILDTARNIMAIIQPSIGDRASGEVTVTAFGADVLLPMNTYAMPVIDGRRRPDLLFKVDEGPNEDRSWTVTSGGTVVDFISNIGGARHNISSGTSLHFDPVVAGLVSTPPTADDDFSGGTDLSTFGAVKDAVIYESFDGTSFHTSLHRSNITGFPCVIVTWLDGEPADGRSVSQTDRPTRVGTRGLLWKDTFALSVVSSKESSDHARRHEGLEIIDTLARLLTDKQMIDKVSVSNPSGIQIRNITRESGPEDIYQKFYIYTMYLCTERTLTQLDARTYSDWLLAVMDVYKPQDPPLPNQGDYTIVDDNEIDMS